MHSNLNIIRMSWKEVLTLKDWFSYRQKIGLLVVAGVVCGLGGLFMYLLRAHTYFIGDDPAVYFVTHAERQAPMAEIVPKWIDEAKKNGKLIEL